MARKPTLKENSAKLDRILKITEHLAQNNLILNLDFANDTPFTMQHYIREILLDLYKQVRKAVTENKCYRGDGFFPITIESVTYDTLDERTGMSLAEMELRGHPWKPLKTSSKKNVTS